MLDGGFTSALNQPRSVKIVGGFTSSLNYQASVKSVDSGFTLATAHTHKAHQLLAIVLKIMARGLMSQRIVQRAPYFMIISGILANEIAQGQRLFLS